MKKLAFNVLDLILIIFLVSSSPALKVFCRIGGRRLPMSRQLLKRLGIYPIRDHYYQPLFNDDKLQHSLRKCRALPGINWNRESQISLLRELKYGRELTNLNLKAAKSVYSEFALGNGSFESGDAEFLYQIIRHFKPKRIIEIGSGFSTKIAKHALDMNYYENSFKTLHICIEPYEHPLLESLGVDILRKPVEDCDLSIFDQLEKGDILFIDSSHIIRPQGDVLTEYLQIIPRLKTGVIVHIHDIFSPRDYLDEWIRDDVYFWNEQYILEALLTNTERYQIVAALNYLKHEYYDLLSSVCPYLTSDREPGSFYFRIT